MDEFAREEGLTNAFLAAEPGAEPVTEGKNRIKLRPFTAGAIFKLKRLGLNLLEKKPEPETAEDEERDETEDLRQIFTIIWMQAAPLTEVNAHIRQGTWEDAVEDFADTVEMDEMPLLMEEINQVWKRLGDAAVEVEKKRDESISKDPDRTPPPNS